MQYIIGVDCGGTSTKAAAYDLSGSLLTEVQTGFGNLLNNAELALANICEALEKIFSTLGEENCQSIILGVAGVDSGNFRQTIQAELSRYRPAVHILNDAWLAHYALLNGEDGCLVIAGTGSIVIGVHGEMEDRVGGWGNLLGDEGSGYELGKKLIKSVLNAFDEGRSYSNLEKRVLAYKAAETPFDLVRFTYNSSKDQIAEVSMVAVEAANEGDKEAIQLFKEAGSALAKQVIQLIRKLGIEDKPKVAVTGSVLLKNDWVFEQFAKDLHTTFTEPTIIRKDTSNAIGGYYYYQKHLI